MKASMATKTDHVLGEKRGQVYCLKINQPGKHNAVSLEAWREIPKLITRAEDDPEVRLIVIQGVGNKAFSAGADISEFPMSRFTREEGTMYNDAHNGGEAAVLECIKPTVALINGWCVGAGLQLAMACDIRIATDDSRFGVTPSRLGIVYPHQATTRMEAEIGPAWTKLMLYTGRIIDCRQAEKINIIQEFGTREEVDKQFSVLVKEIISGEPLAQYATKLFSLRNVQTRTEDRTEKELAQASFTGRNHQRAVSHFLNKSRKDFSSHQAFSKRTRQEK